MKTKDLIICSLFCAITCVIAQISIPLSVPITMQTLAVSLSGIILGSKKGFFSQLIYIFLGGIGLPVFSGFKGVLQIILGPTGGFIITFPLMAFIISYISEKSDKKFILFISIFIGYIINYIGGLIQFMYITKSNLSSAISICIIPFLFTDFIKILLANIIGYKIRKNKCIKNYNKKDAE